MAEQYGRAHRDTQRKLEHALRTAHGQREQEIKDCTAELARVKLELQDEVLRRRQAEHALEVRSAQLRATAIELAHAEQHERQRLSGVLHDHIQQLLASAQFKLSLLAEPMNQRERHEAIREATGILSEAIAQTRSLAVELAPPIISEGGLVPALEWLGCWMRQRHGLTIRVTVDEQAVETGDENIRLILFSAVRELLFNVTKHAKVTAASVKVQRVGDRIQIVVSDSGIGFEAMQRIESESPAVGLGLFGVQKRLDLIGGHFEIDSIPGRGSRFTLQAPVGQRASRSTSRGVPA